LAFRGSELCAISGKLKFAQDRRSRFTLVTKHVLAVLVPVAEYQSQIMAETRAAEDLQERSKNSCCGKKKGSEKMTPNLFDYATKELSQDAFLCWLLAWADEECRDADSTLHALGLSLLNRVLGLHGKAQRECVTVRVHRQLLRADIVAEVGSDTVLLIEDKVHAGLHGDQLERYRREMEKEFGGRELLPVFVKTGDQSSYEEAERSGYRLLLREHILDLLRPWRDRTSNAIFADFLANLESREALVKSYATTPVAQWRQGRLAGRSLPGRARRTRDRRSRSPPHRASSGRSTAARR